MAPSINKPSSSDYRVATTGSTENKQTDTSYLKCQNLNMHGKITAAKHETNTYNCGEITKDSQRLLRTAKTIVTMLT